MPNFINSPNMSLPVPVVGTDPGPDYANNINSSLSIIDGHTHTSGSGVAITTAALNINADLPFNGHGINTISYITMSTQTVAPVNYSISVQGVDLYYTDGNGNNVRITNLGSVNGPFGTISGLPSGTASAAYNAGTFTFQSATNTGAVIDGSSHVFRLNVASSPALTLSPPSALSGGAYQLFLPTIPAQTNVMTIDSSGNMGSVTWDTVGQNMTSTGANAIVATVNSAASADNIANVMDATGANTLVAKINSFVPADAVANNMSNNGANVVGGKINSSTAANNIVSKVARAAPASSAAALGIAGNNQSTNPFSTTFSSPQDVPGLGISIQTTGRPVEVILTPRISSTGAYINVSNSAGGAATGVVRIYNSTTGAYWDTQIGLSGTASSSPFTSISGFFSNPIRIFDASVIGSAVFATYAVQIFLSAGNSIYINEYSVYAYEIT